MCLPHELTQTQKTESQKMEEEQIERETKSLVFAVNGQRFELSSVDPSMTLLEFLRTQTPFKGVKLGCGEGIIFLSVSFFTHKSTSCPTLLTDLISEALLGFNLGF